MPAGDILLQAEQIVETAMEQSLDAALREYAGAILELQRTSAREPLTSVKLNAALKRARAAQDEVAAWMALQQGRKIP